MPARALATEICSDVPMGGVAIVVEVCSGLLVSRTSSVGAISGLLGRTAPVGRRVGGILEEVGHFHFARRCMSGERDEERTKWEAGRHLKKAHVSQESGEMGVRR